jgi:hypothetical protein
LSLCLISVWLICVTAAFIPTCSENKELLIEPLWTSDDNDYDNKNAAADDDDNNSNNNTTAIIKFLLLMCWANGQMAN